MSLPKICTCPTVPTVGCPFHHQEASAASSGSLPSQFKGKFFGVGMGKIFIKTATEGDTTVLDVRGWGYLTGKGGLGMSEDDAVKVQDQFEQWVIDTLNAAIENRGAEPQGGNEIT